MMETNTFLCCKKCADRVVGCHGTCEKYLSAKAKMKEQKRMIEAKKKENSEIKSHRYETVRAAMIKREKKRHV